MSVSDCAINLNKNSFSNLKNIKFKMKIIKQGGYEKRKCYSKKLMVG